jgi:glycosyltransferase involved in cell wall biosynthesis
VAMSASTRRPSRPVLFVTNHVPPDRAGAFAALHARVPVELGLFGGRSHHATAALADPGVPHRHIDQRAVHALAASRRHRAVVCGTAGRVALPAAWLGARRARVPFVLWSALWSELGTPAHLAARPLMAAIYRTAGAVVAYGPHVAAFARERGARRVHVAPQAVDNAWWAQGAPAERPPDRPLRVLFVGRPAPEKGRDVLLAAWEESGLAAIGAGLVLAGGDASRSGATDDPWLPGHVVCVGHQPAERLRNLYGSADVLAVPSIASRRFREPWGLVVNEAMNQHVAIVATDAVGAAAGGLVRDGETGLVVPAGDAHALARALLRLQADPGLRARLGRAGADAVRAHTFEAWADGFAAAIAAAERAAAQGGGRRAAAEARRGTPC